MMILHLMMVMVINLSIIIIGSGGAVSGGGVPPRFSLLTLGAFQLLK